MPDKNEASSQHQFLVRLSGFPAEYYFDAMTGGHESVPFEKWRRGGGGLVNVPGRAEWDNITVTRGYNPVTDPPILKLVAQTIKQAGPIGVSVTPLNKDGSRAYDATNYLGNITRVTKPEYDENSTAVATWGFEIAVVGEA